MTCRINNEKYLNVVESLVKINPSYYNNFDNAAKFILNSERLNIKQKAISLYNLSSIYFKLNELDKYYEAGNASRVIEIFTKLVEPEEYIDIISKFIITDTNKVKTITIKDIENRINKLGEIYNLISDIGSSKGILNYITNYIRSTNFTSQEELIKTVNEIFNKLNSEILSLFSATKDKAKRESLIKQINTVKDKLLVNKNKYIPLNEVTQLAELTENIVTLSSGQTIAVKVQDLSEINGEDIIDNKSGDTLGNAIRTSIGRRNGESVFLGTDSLSNFTFSAIGSSTNNDIKELIKIYNNEGTLQKNIKIHAVKLTNYAAERINRIHNLAKTNPEFKELTNRTHETFEESNQIKKLQLSQNETILTVSRPLPSETPFQLFGEITDKKNKNIKHYFFLNSLDNYTFVKSNNTTTKVDFTNDEHLKLVKELSVKRVFNINLDTPLTNVDLEHLKDSQIEYGKFKNTIVSVVQDKFDQGEPSVDITDEFFNHYNFKRSTIAVSSNLTTVMQKNDKAYQTLNIVTYNEEGKEVITSMNVPFYYKKEGTGDQQKYKLSNILGLGLVQYKNKNGEFQNISLEAYAEKVLGLTQKYITEEILKDKNDTGLSFILSFGKDRISYLLADSVNQIQDVVQFVDYVTSLSEVLSMDNIPSKKTAIENFDKEKFGFKMFGPGIVIRHRFNIETGKFQFLINVNSKATTDSEYERNREYKKIIGNKGLPINIDITEIQKAIEVLKNVDKIKEKFDIFKNIDVNAPGGLVKFYRELNSYLNTHQVNNIIEPFLDSINIAMKDLYSSYHEQFINGLNKIFEENPDFENKLKQEDGLRSRNREQFVPDFLAFTKRTGEWVPMIESPSSKLFKDNEKNFSNYTIREVTNGVIVVPNKTGPTIKQKEIITNQEVVPEPIDKKEPPALAIDIPIIGNYSLLSDGSLELESDTERQSQKEWLLDRLPQAQISPTDVNDLLTATTVNSTILGMMKDRIIYLNDNIKSKGVIYHEAFHFVFRYLMDGTRRQELINNTISKNSSLFTEKSLEDFRKGRNFVGTHEELIKLRAEELLADGFKGYMNNKTKPKGLLEKLFKLIKDLINFFKIHKDIIEQEYKRIDGSYYTNKQINDLGVFDGQEVFELIPGLYSIQRTVAGTPGAKLIYLDSYYQNQLVDVIVAHYITERKSPLNNNKSDELLLDSTIDHVREYVFSITALLNSDVNKELIRKDPSIKNKIIDTYGNLYKNYRFIMGGRLRQSPDDKNAENELISLGYYRDSDVNDTKEVIYDNQIIPNIVDEEDNSKGEVSYSILRRFVKDKIKKVTRKIDMSSSNNEISESSSEDVDLIEPINSNEINSDQEDPDDHVEDVTDKSFNEKSRIDSLPDQMKEFLSTIIYYTKDKNGIQIPKSLDSTPIFNSLLKLTRNINSEDIIDYISEISEALIEEGDEENGMLLKSVVEKLHDSIGYNTETKEYKEHPLYHSFIDALTGPRTDYIIASVISNVETDSYNTGDDYETEDTYTNKSVRFNDKISTKTQAKIKDNLLLKIRQIYNDKKSTPEYIETIDKIQSLINDRLKKDYILSEPDVKAEKLLTNIVNELYENLQKIGITFPKSLLRISVVAIDSIENERENDLFSKGSILSKNTKFLYKANQSLISKGNYLDKGFFNNLNNILNILKNGTDNITNTIRDTANVAKEVQSFIIKIKEVADYMDSIDITSTSGVIRNPENKLIYSYVKYTPMLLMSKDISNNGVLEFLSENEYWDRFEKSYFNDNIWLSELLSKNKLSIEGQKMKLFFDNFKVAIFGGVTQSLQRPGGRIKYINGKSFKNIDEKSLHFIAIQSFLNRTIHEKTNTKGDKIKIETYMRTMSQLESSNTNFFIPALYESYIDKQGMVKDENGYLKITNLLLSNVKQEYNRSLKEWRLRDKNKTDYDNVIENNILNKFNGILGKDYKAVTDDTNLSEEDKLRAYNQNKLRDFFDKNESLKSDLRNALNEDKDFDKFDGDLKDRLLDGLEKYANEQLTIHLENLVKLGLVKKEEYINHISVNGKFVPQLKNGKEVIQNVYIASDIIVNDLQLNGKTEEKASKNYIAQSHTDSKGEIVTHDDSIKGLLTDSFFNYWANSLQINEIFIGDMAMGVKDSGDYFKRLKKFLASGSNGRGENVSIAVINTIKAHINNTYHGYGPYYSLQEINEDTTITDETIRETIKKDFLTDEKKEIFDGQSISTLFHQMDFHRSQGRLSDKVLRNIIKKHFSPLTKYEIKENEREKVVNNPKKTIVASQNLFIKQSENYTDRLDVSYIDVPNGLTYDEVLDRLEEHYTAAYNYRKTYKEFQKEGRVSELSEIKELYQTEIKKAHSYFKPYEHRKHLYTVLNSMEYHMIDQLIDPTSSKNTTILPIDFYNEFSDDEYMNLPFSSMNVNSVYKFSQLETSGVKDKIRLSVQQKLLTGTDIKNIFAIVNKGKKLTPAQQKEQDKLDMFLNEYQESLKDVVKANNSILTRILRTGQNADFELGSLYDLIRDKLVEQGAPSTSIGFFTTKKDASGKSIPVHNPNMIGVRKILENYIFALYSKAVTDEKGTGSKFTHISSWGYDVVEDLITRKVIPTSEINRNPDFYKDKTLYKARPLRYKVETINGVKTYTFECIVPMPMFSTDPVKAKIEKDFFMKNLTKMFAVRIPTEDYRSMVVLNVVDFIDSSNLNGIIVPHLAHLLAGSDFDIDSLFAHIMASYKDFLGQPNLYGDYSNYSSPEFGKFAEFLNYMSTHQLFSSSVRLKENEIKNGTNDFKISDAAKDILYEIGFERDEFHPNMIKDYFKDISIFEKNNTFNEDSIEAFDDLRNELDDIDVKLRTNKVSYLNNKGEITENILSNDARTRLIKREKEVKEKLKDVKLDLDSEHIPGFSKKLHQYATAAMRIESIIQVLANHGIPVDFKAYTEKTEYHDMTVPVYQNNNLRAKINLLSNETVFNNIYINERSSPDELLDALQMYGIDAKKFGKDFNMLTIDAVFKTKHNNSSNKTGIEILASTNKFLAFANQMSLTLNSENVVWEYRNANKERISRNSYGYLTDDYKRIISSIGNLLGIMADASKLQAPAAARLNETNTPILALMVGVGNPLKFSLGFNFISSISKAVDRVQKTQVAVTNGEIMQYEFLSNALSKEISLLLTEERLTRLKDLGVIEQKSWSNSKTLSSRIILNKNNIIIEHEPKVLDKDKLNNNELTIDDIGFKVSINSKGNLVQLSNEEAEVILTQYYLEQSNQRWKVLKTGKITNMFKKLKPSIPYFDKMYEDVLDLYNNAFDDEYNTSIFTKESVRNIFDYNVYYELFETIDDFYEQLNKIFIERIDLMKPITNMFKPLFNDVSIMGNILVNFISINKYRNIMPGLRKSKNPDDQFNIDLEDDILVNMFTADYWHNNTLRAELEAMKAKYPENLFLKLLDVEEIDNGKFTQSFIRMQDKDFTKGSYQANIAHDAESFLKRERVFGKKLFIHELAVTGGSYKEKSYIDFLSHELSIPLSKFVEEFIEKIKTIKSNPTELINIVKEAMGLQDKSNEKLFDTFNELFIHLVNGAINEVGNTKIKFIQPVKANVDTGGSKYDSALVKEISKSSNIIFDNAEINKLEKEYVSLLELRNKLINEQNKPKFKEKPIISIILPVSNELISGDEEKEKELWEILKLLKKEEKALKELMECLW